MNKLGMVALLAAFGTAGAQAANVGFASVTGTAGVTNAAKAGDGVFPALGQFYQQDTAYWTGQGESVLYTFDMAYRITGMTLSVDNNDFYRVELSSNGSTWQTYHTVLAFEGSVNGGMDTFSPSLPATADFYSFARITALAGDGLNSVGELQLNGVAAVPEPETMALMLAGLAAFALKLRRKA
jgi:hypothetical protein